MKVLLIEPRSCWIGLNIALGYLAASLKRAGIEVKILDFTNHRQLPVEKLEKAVIESYKPDLIGMPVFYTSYFVVKDQIARIKQYCNCPVVCGGPQVVIEQKQMLLDIPELDFVLVGDGEDAIVELCDAIRGKRQLSSIAGLIYRNGGELVSNQARAVAPDIDSIPYPDYEPFGIERMGRYSIITSRGCPHSCTYCFRSTPKWRPRSPENIIGELKSAMEKYKISEFGIVDDSFNIQPERIEKFCALLAAEKINLPWACSGVRADRVNEHFIKTIRAAGCYSVNIGVETLQPELYKNLNRNMPIEKVIDCMHLLKKYGFNTVGYFMIGLPGETKAMTWDTYLKAKAAGIDYPRFSILLPIPCTKMYDDVYNQPGVRKLEDYRNISTVWTYDPKYSRMKTAFETPEYTAEEKVDIYNKLRTMEGDPRPPYHSSLFVFALHALLWVLKYDLPHAPKTVYKLAKNFLSRFLKSGGKHVYMTDNVYSSDFLNEMNTLIADK